MEIIKQLKIETFGNKPDLPNGVLIQDGDVQYPVLNEALVNTVIFPALRDSGYKLVALPAKFEKDNQAVSNLPVVDYKAATPEDEQKMFTMVGTKTPDLEKYLEKPVASVLKTPATNYRIHTREEFIQYLLSIKNNIPENDVEPINYFVAPEAQFSYEEYFDPDNKEYRSIIEHRRMMSYDKFLILFSWLSKTLDIKTDSDPFTVIRAYMAWGIDGIKYDATIANNQQSEISIHDIYFGRSPIIAPALEFCTGMTDRHKSKLLPIGIMQDADWELTPISEVDITAFRDENDPNLYNIPKSPMVVTYQRPTMFKTRMVSCGNYFYQFDTKDIAFNRNAHEMITLRVLTQYGDQLPIAKAIPSEENIKWVAEQQYIHAIAEEMHRKRYQHCDATSYNVLARFGLTPPNIINYIALKLGVTEAGSVINNTIDVNGGENEEERVQLTEDKVNAYCSGEYNENGSIQLSDEEIEQIERIVSGEDNCDSIAAGISSDNTYSTSKLEMELAAIHYVMGVPLDEIAEKVKAAKVGDTIEFTGRNLTDAIVMSPINGQAKGADSDFQLYSAEASKYAHNIIKVTKAIREIGNNDATRHVACEFLCLERTTAVNAALDVIMNDMTEAINNNIADARVKQQFLDTVYVLAEGACFEIYETGQYTCPVTRTKKDAPLDVARAIDRNTTPMFDTIAGLTRYSMYTTSTTKVNEGALSSEAPASYLINIYCVNAMITPDRILPKKKRVIPEVSFMPIWKSYYGTTILDKLIEADIIPRGFTPYSEVFDKSKIYFKRYDDAATDHDSPDYYYNIAVSDMEDAKEDNMHDIPAVTHPVEYLYPSIYPKNEEYETRATPSNGIDLHIGFKRDITDQPSDSWNNYYETESDVPGISTFHGFSMETFYLGLNVFNLKPVVQNPAKQLVVLEDKISTTDTMQIYDYTRIQELVDAGYPVKHIRNNVYLLKEANGVLHKVVV